MSKPNPTRPRASTQEVLATLAALSPPAQTRLKQYRYNVGELRRIAEYDGEQADAVDALLAIVTDRKGYEFDSADLTKATKVYKNLDGAFLSPSGHLQKRGKLKVYYGGPRGGTPPGSKPSTWGDALAGLAICLGVIVVLFVLFLLFR